MPVPKQNFGISPQKHGFVQLRGLTTPEVWRVLNPLVKSTRIAGGRESVSWAGLWDQGDVSNQKLPLAMNSRRPKLGCSPSGQDSARAAEAGNCLQQAQGR